MCTDPPETTLSDGKMNTTMLHSILINLLSGNLFVVDLLDGALLAHSTHFDQSHKSHFTFQQLLLSLSGFAALSTFLEKCTCLFFDSTPFRCWSCFQCFSLPFSAYQNDRWFYNIHKFQLVICTANGKQIRMSYFWYTPIKCCMSFECGAKILSFGLVTRKIVFCFLLKIAFAKRSYKNLHFSCVLQCAHK